MTADPMLQWLGMPVGASAHAAEVDRIMVLVHWLMLVLFVGWGIFFAYVLVRFRRGRQPRAVYHGVRGRWSTWIEGGVLAAEIVLLAFFSIPFWSTNVDALPEQHQSTVVRVPGIVQPIYFTPTELGRWDIACSQLCGLAHYRMRGIYEVQSQAAYDAWLKEEAALLVEQQ